MKEAKSFLAIYAVIIVVLLGVVMFVLPDSFFSRKYEENTKEFLEAHEQANKEREEYETEKKKPFVDYQKQQEIILNGTYDYEYIFLDSMGTETYDYNCSGKKNKNVDSGTCTNPEAISYTEQNKKEKLNKYTDSTYMIEKNIFDLIKNIEPEEETHQVYRKFTYKTKIKDLETTIEIETKKDYISKITLLNPYMSYMFKYDNVIIDN